MSYVEYDELPDELKSWLETNRLGNTHQQWTRLKQYYVSDNGIVWNSVQQLPAIPRTYRNRCYVTFGASTRLLAAVVYEAFVDRDYNSRRDTIVYKDGNSLNFTLSNVAVKLRDNRHTVNTHTSNREVMLAAATNVYTQLLGEQS